MAMISLATRRKNPLQIRISPLPRPFLNAHPLEIFPTAFLFKPTHYGSPVTEVTVLHINLNYWRVTPQRLWGEENKGQK